MKIYKKQIKMYESVIKPVKARKLKFKTVGKIYGAKIKTIILNEL